MSRAVRGSDRIIVCVVIFFRFRLPSGREPKTSHLPRPGQTHHSKACQVGDNRDVAAIRFRWVLFRICAGAAWLGRLKATRRRNPLLFVQQCRWLAFPNGQSHEAGFTDVAGNSPQPALSCRDTRAFPPHGGARRCRICDIVPDPARWCAREGVHPVDWRPRQHVCNIRPDGALSCS